MPVANSVAVTAGSTLVAGWLTQFVAAPGDTFNLAGVSVPLVAVPSTAELTLAYGWPGASLTDRTDWAILKTGDYWASTRQVNTKITDLIAKLEAGIPFKPDAAGTLANRATYDAQAQGFAYLRTDVSPALLYIHGPTAGSWSAGVQLQGNPGNDGSQVEFQQASGYIQWREVGSATWANLVPLADLVGQDGPAIELQVAGGYIQWRVVGAATWINLIALTALKGDTGDPGDKGWAPVLAIVADGTRRVLQVSDWTGGAGAKPATGSYVGSAGLVSTAAAAIDIRGPTGAGTGDVLAANNLSDLVDKAVARNNLELGTAATKATGTAPGNVPVLDVGGKIDAAVLPSISAGGGAGNLLINGDFRIWQRGISFTAAAYSADRWAILNTAGTRTVSRQANTAVDGSAYALRYDVAGGTAAGNFDEIRQSIEGVRRTAGLTLSLSFYARVVTGSGEIATELVQYFGTGGGASADVNAIGVAKHSLTTLWQRFTVNGIAIPSALGKSVGTSGDDALRLNIWMSAGTTFNSRTSSLGPKTQTVELRDVQLEVASTASAQFNRRELGEELRLCQRYYAKSYPQSVNPGTTTLQAGSLVCFAMQTGNYVTWAPVKYPVTMRKVPSITMYNPITGGTGTAYNLDASASVAVVTANASEDVFTLWVNNVSVTGGNSVIAHYVADAEI